MFFTVPSPKTERKPSILQKKATSIFSCSTNHCTLEALSIPLKLLTMKRGKRGRVAAIPLYIYCSRRYLVDIHQPQNVGVSAALFATRSPSPVSWRCSNRRTPSSLYSPEYSLEDSTDSFEVRRYASYSVCSAAMAAGMMVCQMGGPALW